MAIAWALSGWFLSLGAGCAHLLETRSIAQFTEELGRGDLEGLRSSTSADFERKALRDPDAIEDLRILKLPTEKPTVVRVKDSQDSSDEADKVVTEKLVEVEVGESGRKLLYKLVREANGGRWVVDDIYVRQKHDGVTATRSVTEQMDLLLTVRDFLRAWGDGSRNDVLGVATQEFGQTLGELPPPYLASFTRRIIGEAAERKSKPQATVDHDSAEVSIPRAGGKLVVSCRLVGGQWKISDVAVDSRTSSERLPSARGQAEALLAAVRFLDAYSAADKTTLDQTCAPHLSSCLKLADMGRFPLPNSREALPRHEIRVIGPKAEFEVPGKTQILKVQLERPLLDGGGLDDNVAVERGPYRVQSVTLYQIDGSQERRLSAVLTAEPIMEIFAQAFAQRDLEFLRKVSTLDFRERLWDRIGAAALEDSAFDVIDPSPPQILNTSYRGAVTEITVTQGGRPLSYVLQDVAGEWCVDDVLVPAVGRPESLKRTMEILLPIRAYAAGMSSNDLQRLQRGSSDDFNRLVWGQIRQVPDAAAIAVAPLMLPLARIEPKSETETLVVLGDDRHGARVMLVKERGLSVVDDIELLSEGRPIALKGRLRQDLAERMLAASRPESPRRGSAGDREEGIAAGPVHQRPISTDARAAANDVLWGGERYDDSRLHDLRSDDLPAIEIPSAADEPTRVGQLPSVELDDELGDLPLR
ncbi:MAG: hypothetical protein WD066_07920 [Planctomycetaceae bacterium]